MCRLWEKIYGAAKNVGIILRKYWSVYGGAIEVFTSPYFIMSCLLLILTANFWLKDFWRETPISVLPNIISFTLGGYALFIALGDEKFKRIISGPTVEKSPAMSIGATFTHFLIVQAVAITLAIIAKSRPYTGIFSIIDINLLPKEAIFILILIAKIAAGIAFLVFLYSILGIIALSLSLFRVAGWLDAFLTKKENTNEKKL